MTDITININTGAGNEPEVAMKTGTSKPIAPKVEPPKAEASKDGQKTEPPKEELKKEAPKEDQKKEAPKEDDAKEMGMTEEEHAKMSSEKDASKE